VPLLLGSFIGIGSMQTVGTSTAALVPTASPMPAGTILPVAVNINDFQQAMATGAMYDLLAPATLPSGAASSMLDFANSPPNAFAAGGQPPDYGYSQHTPVSSHSTGPLSILTNLQYWTDTRHAVTALALGPAATLALAPPTPILNSAFVDNPAEQAPAYADAFTTGLLDNIRQQGRVNASGTFGLVWVPLWDTVPSYWTVHVAALAMLRVQEADVTAGSARGHFVLYPASAWAMPQPVTIEVGARLVRLIG
jgi:hypothetical protein